MQSKLVRSAALAMIGAAAGFLYEWAMAQSVDWAPAVAAGASFVANVVRLMAKR